MKLWIKTYIIFINKECKQWFFFYLHTSKIQSDSSKNPFKLVFLTLRVERGWPDGQEFLEKIFPRKKSWGACGVEPKLPPMFGSRSFIPSLPQCFLDHSMCQLSVTLRVCLGGLSWNSQVCFPFCFLSICLSLREITTRRSHMLDGSLKAIPAYFLLISYLSLFYAKKNSGSDWYPLIFVDYNYVL